jgi:hypothetical protein
MDVDASLPHHWVDVRVSCDDCGDHAAVRCDNEDCPCDGAPIDLVRYDDPRDKPHSGVI